MNRYLWLFLSLFALAGYTQPGHAHSRAAPAHTAQAAQAKSPSTRAKRSWAAPAHTTQAAQLAGAGPAAEPGPHAPAATVPERRPVISYSTSEAAVQLEHDYQGCMQPDVAQTLTLRFRHGYTAGVMRVAFYAHDGLELYNAKALRSLPLDAAQPLSMPIRLTAPSAGQYYLSIFATVELPDGEVAHRIFGLDLHAGDESEIADQARRASKTRRVRETPGSERSTSSFRA